MPPIELSYNNLSGEVHTLRTLPVRLRVVALLDESNEKPEPRELRSPRSALVEDRRIVAALKVGLIGLGGVLLLLVVRRFLRRGRSSESVIAASSVLPARPPAEVALERLQTLKQQGLFSRDGYRPYYFELAEIVRAYLGGRYRFDALELTTTELLAELENRAPTLLAGESSVVRFLHDTDLVKFAKAGSTDSEALGLWEAACHLVLSTSTEAPAGEAPAGETPAGETPAGGSVAPANGTASEPPMEARGE